jgi:predicted MFS family arabinose efflux permease
MGGVWLPFASVSGMAVLCAGAFLWLDLPSQQAAREPTPLGSVFRVPDVLSCSLAVVTVAATLAMLEPVLSLFLSSAIALGPARVGLVFGAGAVASAVLHPIYGRMVDRVDSRRLTLIGLAATGLVLPLVSRAWSFESAVLLFVVQAGMTSLVITPSLTFMAEATSEAGVGSFGVAYGLYNVAWGVGLLGGPALGGYLYERLGFPVMALWWAPSVLVVTGLIGARLSRAKSRPSTALVGDG